MLITIQLEANLRLVAVGNNFEKWKVSSGNSGC